MKVALKLLKQYVPIDWTEKEISDALVQLGFEIESVETLGYCGTGPLVVGQVLEKEKHPNADHLSICRVTVGLAEPLQIVCGAKNFKAGDLVPVALIGAKLGDVVLKKTHFRGWDSYGMMCSASELGLEVGESEGLYILNNLQPAVGTPLEVLFADKKDVVLDVAIPSNRGDCLSYLGLARELSALAEVPVKWPEVSVALPGKTTGNIAIETEDCDYFSGCLVEGISIGPSTPAMQEFLTLSGLRPINNVVDVTNYILLECGQPLHAFDADQIKGALRIRSTQGMETLTTLDGVGRTLSPGMVVIADAEKTLSLAGVMGGASSEIRATTTRIFVECAHFNPTVIRSTVHRLNIMTDSAFRFERFVDKTQVQYVLRRALQLLQETNPNMRVKTYHTVGSNRVLPRTVEIKLGLVRRVLGVDVAADLFVNTLRRLGFQLEELEHNHWRVQIPCYREDIVESVDLVEEFIRLWGTDRIPDQLPQGTVCTLEDAPEDKLRTAHGSLLSQAGFYECYTDTLQPRMWYDVHLSAEVLSALTLSKPLSAEHDCLRYSLIPGLVDRLHYNRCNGNTVQRMFETGHIFRVNRNHQLCEFFATAFVYCPSSERYWKNVSSFDFQEAQGLMRSLLMAGGMPSSAIQTAIPSEMPLWQAQYSGKIGLWEQQGFEANLGYLDLSFTRHWFKTDALIAGECFWLPERIHCKKPKTFQPFSEYPVIEKDLALWVPQETLAEVVRQALIKTLKKLAKQPVEIRDVRLFDVFKGEDNEQKSLAFTLIFGAQNTTLTEEMVNPIFENLQESMEKSFNYQVRKQTL